VLVEGNFDVITLHQAGFTDVVAPLGTALTPEQIGVLRRLVERVVLLYDGDRAGYKATMHALQLCMEQEVDVLIASSPGHAKSGGLSGPLTGGVDPDSLVAGGGAELLREAIDRAKGGVEFFAFEVWSKAKNNLDARARALDDAARLVAKVGNPMKRDLIVGTLASGMEIDPSVVRGAIARASGQGGGPPSSSQQRYGQTRGPGHPNAPDSDGKPSTTGGPPAPMPPTDEVEVISLLADHPSLIATAEADKAFWLLTDARLQAMYSAARAGQSLLELAGTSGQLPPSTTVQVLSGKYADSKDPRAELISMTRNLEVRKSGVGSAELKKNLALAHRRGDRELERKLAQLAVAERQGDHELVAELRASLESETSNGKQVD
jgi:DNA primase